MREIHKMEFAFATRRWTEHCPKTQREYVYVDRMVRRGRDFYLIEEPSQPGEEVHETRYTLRQVFAWLREMPEQIERAVYCFR